MLVKCASLTDDEIAIAYSTYARARQCRLLRTSVVTSQVQDLMMELYAISKSHDLKREAGNGDAKPKTSRGYHGVRLREPNEEDPDF